MFVLKSKSWILILKEFDFFNIFIGFKWGVFSYLHLCFKVNRELRNVNKYIMILKKCLEKKKKKMD